MILVVFRIPRLTVSSVAIPKSVDCIAVMIPLVKRRRLNLEWLFFRIDYAFFAPCDQTAERTTFAIALIMMMGLIYSSLIR